VSSHTTIQLRRDTAANWTSANPVLAQGEVGFEHDTLRFKVGNGSTAWTSLAYARAGLADTATALAGGAAGGVPYQTGSGATAFLPVGAAGRVLVVNAGATAPEWTQPKLNAFATTTSSELLGVISGTTGTGNLVFATSPALTSPSLTTPAVQSGGATFAGSTSGTVTLRASAVASGTLNLPAVSGTNTLATQEFAAATYLPLTGGALTGALTGTAITLSGNLSAANITLTGTLDTSLTAGVVKSNSTGVLSASAVNLASEVTGTLPIANGGTGATSASAARTALGVAAASHTHAYTDITGRDNGAFGAGSVKNWGNHSTNTRIWVQSAQPSSGQEGDLYFWG